MLLNTQNNYSINFAGQKYKMPYTNCIEGLNKVLETIQNKPGVKIDNFTPEEIIVDIPNNAIKAFREAARKAQIKVQKTK